MAFNIIKLLKSITPGSRPSGQTYGVPYVNFGDNQFGAFDSSNVARDLIGVPYFSAATTYSGGQPANYQGQVYVAKTAVAAGTFNPAQWIPVNPNTNWTFGGFVNKFRNPKFDFWQHGNNVTVPSGSGTLAADGWYFTPTGSSMTAVNTTAVPAGVSQNVAMSWFGVAGNTASSVYQFLESYSVHGFGGQTITASLMVYNSTSGTITPTLNASYANAIDNWSGNTSFLGATNLQPCPAGVWTRVAYTFNAPTQSKNGLLFSFNFPGNTVTSNYVMIAQADVRVTPGLPVGLCANPPPFEDRPLATELTYVRRYYQGGGNQHIWSGVANTSFLAYSFASFATPMRTIPTLTILDISNNNFPVGSATVQGADFLGVMVAKTPSASAYGWFQWGFIANCEF